MCLINILYSIHSSSLEEVLLVVYVAILVCHLLVHLPLLTQIEQLALRPVLFHCSSVLLFLRGDIVVLTLD